VASFSYSSTTSNQLASYAANFPPANTGFTFDSFTNVATINTLATPATVDGSYFFYDLVSSAAPEPAAWMVMILGIGGVGAAAREQRRKRTTTVV